MLPSFSHWHSLRSPSHSLIDIHSLVDSFTYSLICLIMNSWVHEFTLCLLTLVVSTHACCLRYRSEFSCCVVYLSLVMSSSAGRFKSVFAVLLIVALCGLSILRHPFQRCVFMTVVNPMKPFWWSHDPPWNDSIHDSYFNHSVFPPPVSSLLTAPR